MKYKMRQSGHSASYPPPLHPLLPLSFHCTGISQSTVDSAPTFPDVHARFTSWLYDEHRLGSERTFAVVTDGPFDMGRFLFLQTHHLGMEFPDYAREEGEGQGVLAASLAIEGVVLFHFGRQKHTHSLTHVSDSVSWARLTL